MNIQIFGKKKCFDTKKAERWFKERRIKFQQIDLVRFGMSGGEFDSVLRAVGGVDALMEAMESAYLDEPTYRLLLRSNAAFNAIMEDTYGANGEKLSEADVLAWANDNNYVRCKHILFLTKNDDGTDMTDEEKAEVRKEAETTLEELRALESDRVHLVVQQENRLTKAVFGT